MKTGSVLTRVFGVGVAVGVCFWALAQANAAVVFEDLTPGVAGGSVYTYGSNYQGAPTLTNQYFVGGQWIAGMADANQWAQYAFGGSRYVGYVLLGGNVGRVPISLKVQYTTDASPGAGGTWIDVSSVPPEGGLGLNYVVVDKVATAVRVTMANGNSYSDLEAFRVYGSSDLSCSGRMNTNDSAATLGQATISLVNTWENNLGAMSVMTHLTNTLVPGDSVFRGNGDLASKPELRLSWSANQLLSGVDIASRLWSPGSGAGAIYAMHVDALPKDMDPALATEPDWSTVATYSDAFAGSKLIHLQFDNGSLQTRGLRLVLTDVGDGPYGASRAGGDISELVLAGGLVPAAAPTGGVVFVKSVVLGVRGYFGDLQWQKSADGSGWTDVAGATSTNLDVTALYTNTPWFQVKVTSGTNAPAYSQHMLVTSQEITRGTIFVMK